ncbi:MAG: AMP-binding protein, partial [Deltaproteobacteria bacterium]|nr:AMP-binding protein [Deltaproteobacteria bacterium]
MTKADHPENKPYSPLDEAAELLDVIRKLTLELHPHRMGTLIVTLDSSLDHDLGYDSLGRIELLARIEEKFGVGISEQALAGAETPKDLLRALITAQPAKSRKERIDVHDLKLGDVEETPGSAQTLLDVIGWHVKAHAERPHVLYYDEEQQLHELTYRQLWDRSEALAAGLIKAGLEPGQTVAIMLPTCLEYFYSFAGVLMAGGIPVPIYPPVRASQIEDHLRRHAGILANARTRVLITIPEAKIAARLLRMQVETLDSITTPEELSLPGMAVPPAHVTGEHLAHIQYTSGSTGNPKGVMLTHSNLLANVRAMGENLRVDSTDVFVSWLPLYHDMGLIGAWMGSMYFAMPLVLMSPLSFLAHPERWLMAIHRHRGTLSGSPNFAYELLLRRVSDEQLKGLDLSSWRAAFNGAEPVVPGTIHRFIERFSAYGLRSQSVMPVYGLAEASVGLAFPPPDREPIIDRVKRDIFMTQGLAELAEEDDPNVLEFVACGQPLPRHEVRIVDDSGLELGEGEEGRLEFKGPSVTSGYYRNPEATRDLFNGEWVDSGDQAYIRGGDVYLTGRRKDIIIRAGRNIYPHELEEAVGNLEGIRKGCVAVFGTTDRGSGTEKLVVLAESRVSDPKKQEELRREIESRALDLLGNPVDDIVLVPPHSVPKTSSGKIRRASSKELYENGASAVVRRAVWLQVARLWLAGLAPQWRRWRKLVSTWLFGIYWLICLPLLATPVWLLTALVPVKGWVWWISRLGARLL